MGKIYFGFAFASFSSFLQEHSISVMGIGSCPVSKNGLEKKWHCYSRKVFVQIVTVCDHYGYLKCKGES